MSNAFVLSGNRHPSAIAQFDAGAVSPTYRMDRMVLTLLPMPAQQDALEPVARRAT